MRIRPIIEPPAGISPLGGVTLLAGVGALGQVVDSLTQQILSGALPQSLVDMVVKQIIDTESNLKQLAANIDVLSKASPPPANLDELRRKKIELFTAHQKMKFYAAMVPALREGLGLGTPAAKVRPADMSIVNANANAADKGLLSVYSSEIASLKTAGALAGLGFAPAVGGLAVAAAAAAAIVIYKGIAETAATLRVQSDNAATQALAKLVAEGKVPASVLTDQQKAIKNREPPSDPLEQLKQIAIFGGVAVVGVMLLPTIIAAVKSARRA